MLFGGVVLGNWAPTWSVASPSAPAEYLDICADLGPPGCRATRQRPWSPPQIRGASSPATHLDLDGAHAAAAQPACIRLRSIGRVGVRLIEREEPLGRLRQALCDEDGDGWLALVHGEPGVGKSALVAAAIADLPAGVMVLRAGCDALSTPRPLGPVRDLVGDWGEAVGHVLSADAPVHELFSAVLEQLRSAPTVLVIEDVHWADEATLDLVRYLGRRIMTTRSTVVLTYRDVDVGAGDLFRAVLGDLVREASTVRIPVVPLSVDGVVDLLDGLALDAEEVHRKTGGNPFFVTEVIANPDVPVPNNVRDAVLGRAVRLDGASRDALDLLSCLPVGADAGWLSSLGVPAEALDELAHRGLVVWDGHTVRFRHEVARLAIFEALPGGRRQQLHGRLLMVLRGTGDHALLVHLAHEAGDAGEVVEHATRAAAAAAAAGAHVQAAAFLELAVPASDRSGRAALLESLSYERYHVDQINAAVDAISEALQLRRDTGESAMAAADLRWLSRLEWFRGHRATAEHHADESLSFSTESGDEREIGFSHGQLATLAMTRGEPGPALAHGRLALEIAERFDDDELRAPTLTTVGMAELIAGEMGGAERIRQSATIAGRLGMDDHAARALNNLSFFLVEERRLGPAAGALEEGMRFTTERDLDTFHLYSLGTRARLRVHRGHWTAAWDDATAVLQSSPAPLNAIWPLWVRGVLGVRRGDQEPLQALERAWEVASGFDELYRLVPIATALVEHEWLTGADVSGKERLVAVATRLQGTVGRWQIGEANAWLVRIGHDALDATAPATPYTEQLAGDPVSAAAAWAALGMPYEQALALIDTDTPAALTTALEICHDLGATVTAGWVRQRLRHHGVASPPRGPRPSTRANPAGLTARQVDVLRLLSEGASNAEIAQRLFISEKTAGHHVSAILTKLQVGSRHDAAQVAAELGVVA